MTSSHAKGTSKATLKVSREGPSSSCFLDKCSSDIIGVHRLLFAQRCRPYPRISKAPCVSFSLPALCFPNKVHREKQKEGGSSQKKPSDKSPFLFVFSPRPLGLFNAPCFYVSYLLIGREEYLQASTPTPRSASQILPL